MALVKSNGNLIAIAIKKEQRTDTKKDEKRIKSDNFTRSNREKSNIGNLNDWIALIISYFCGSNNIFADCSLMI